MQDGPFGLTEIAREDQLARALALAHPQLEDGRAEDVAGIAQAELDARYRIGAHVVFDRTQQAQAGLCLCHRVERRRCRASDPAAAMAVPQHPLAFLFLDVRAVEKQHAHEIDGRRRGVDRPAITEHREARQQAGVIDVGMRQQHEVQRAHIEGKGTLVLLIGIATALEHAAVNQETGGRALDQEARAGHFAGRAEKCDFHGQSVRPPAFREFDIGQDCRTMGRL